MLRIDNRYERVAPSGDVSIIRISSEAEVKYHEELAAAGYVYKELKVAAPVDSACLSCEG
jgi:hypothetical protein